MIETEVVLDFSGRGIVSRQWPQERCAQSATFEAQGRQLCQFHCYTDGASIVEQNLTPIGVQRFATCFAYEPTNKCHLQFRSVVLVNS